MPNIINAIWNGDICLCDHCGTQDAAIKQLLMHMEQNRNALSAQLTPAQQALFEKYTDCSEDYLLRLTEHAFCDGVRFASQLWVEALAERG